jgi:ribonuclease R
LGNEYFRYQERAHALCGDASGETYRLGDPVTVRLVEAVPVAGALRFEMLSEGRRDATARILAKSHRPGSPRKPQEGERGRADRKRKRH